MTTAHALEWLYGTQLFGIKLGLDNMRQLLGALNLPAREQQFIHVAGTNGKGSTCAMIAAICRAAGLRTGLFTSPHLVSFTERMQINGQQIPEAELAEDISRLQTTVRGWDAHPTFFELTTALALQWFARRGTDVIVLETGMGGRLDATNVVEPLVSVLTSISFDHEQWLGDSLSAIAAEKAGIIKPEVPVVSAPQAADAKRVLEDVAWNQGCEIEFVSEPWGEPLPLSGEHQRWNAALAVAAVKAAGLTVPMETVVRGLAQTYWPARFQRIGERLVIDGAHNPAGAEALAVAWRHTFQEQKAAVVFGAVSSKDLRGVLKALAPVSGRFHLVQVNSPRGVAISDLAGLVREICPSSKLVMHESLAEAISGAGDGKMPVLVTGSLYLCGEALATLQPGAIFEPSAQ